MNSCYNKMFAYHSIPFAPGCLQSPEQQDAFFYSPSAHRAACKSAAKQDAVFCSLQPTRMSSSAAGGRGRVQTSANGELVRAAAVAAIQQPRWGGSLHTTQSAFTGYIDHCFKFHEHSLKPLPGAMVGQNQALVGGGWQSGAQALHDLYAKPGWARPS